MHASLRTLWGLGTLLDGRSVSHDSKGASDREKFPQRRFDPVLARGLHFDVVIRANHPRTVSVGPRPG